MCSKIQGFNVLQALFINYVIQKWTVFCIFLKLFGRTIKITSQKERTESSEIELRNL